MAPLTPDWVQPSHPDVQKVLINEEHEFTTKSVSTVNLPPYAVFAKLAFPPCTEAEKPTYATVQMGRKEHLNLNSDLVYINHSCDPSLIFDMSSLNIIVGGKGLKEGEELTFFYPSTEWDMAQGFSCFCGTTSCLGFIGGSKDMQASQLEGYWLNAHIRNLIEERDGASSGNGKPPTPLINGKKEENTGDVTEKALKESLEQARKMVNAAQKALDTYISVHSDNSDWGKNGKETGRKNGVGSRELSGEMGGDTVV